MTLDQLETAVGQRLEGMTDCPPIAWPNQDFTPSGTYIEFRHAPNGRIDETIDAAGARFEGLFVITAVVQSGGFSTAANTLAQAIMDRFPKALRLTAGSGNVVINAPASPGSGFQDGAYWRQPVIVSYVTE